MSVVERLFVDGDNVRRSDLAVILYRFPTLAADARRIYQTQGAQARAGYAGFHQVVVPNLGKESVDKAIAMDAVDAWHEGLRHIGIVSSDADHGGTALHLRRRYPQLKVTIYADPARTIDSYFDRLNREGIVVQPMGLRPEELGLNAEVRDIFSALFRLWSEDRLNLAALGDALKRRGCPHANLRQTLIRQGVLDEPAARAAKDVSLATYLPLTPQVQGALERYRALVGAYEQLAVRPPPPDVLPVIPAPVACTASEEDVADIPPYALSAPPASPGLRRRVPF